MRLVRVVKYWFKLLYTDNCILKQILINDVNWVSQINAILLNNGFADVWMYPYAVDVNAFLTVFKQKIKDTYVTNWRANMNVSSRLWLYQEFKTDFVLEKYLVKIVNPKLRKSLTRFRCVSHKLCIETGRHGKNRRERQERICMYCNLNDIEDGYHFLLVCPLYKDERKLYIKKYFWNYPSVYKCITLLSSENINVVRNLAKYIQSALYIRTNTQYDIV